MKSHLKWFSVLGFIAMLVVMVTPASADPPVRVTFPPAGEFPPAAYCAFFGYDDLFIINDGLTVERMDYLDDSGALVLRRDRISGTSSLTRVETGKTVQITQHRTFVREFEDGIRLSTEVSGSHIMSGGNLQRPLVTQAGRYIVPPGNVLPDDIVIRHGIFRLESVCDLIIDATN